MKVYVDNMLVKSTKAKDHIQHIDKMFSILRKYKIWIQTSVHLKCRQENS